MTLRTVSIKLEEELIRRIDSIAKVRSSGLRRAIVAGLDVVEEEDESVPAHLDDRTRFILAVERHFHFVRACREANVSVTEASGWLGVEGDEGDDFRRAYDGAKNTFIESIEYLLIEAGRGERTINKSAITGLIAFLNNHHKNWGRVKIELLNRIFGQIIKQLLRVVHESVDEVTYREIAEKFKDVKNTIIYQFSE